MWDALRRRTSTLVEYAIGIATLVSLALVTLLSLWYTAKSADPDSELMYYAYPLNPELWPQWALGMLASLACAALLLAMWRVLDRVGPKSLLLAALVLTSAFGIAWVSAQATTTTLFADANHLVSYATGFVNGDLTGSLHEEAVWYFSRYPYQSGMFLYYVGMFKLFGAGNIMALKYANVIANELVLLSLYAIGRRLLATPRARNTLTVLVTLFLPFWMLGAFPYGNCVGFALVAVYVACQVEALVSETPRTAALWSAASFLPLALGMSVKATFILLELAVIAAWAVRALRGRGLVGLVAALALFAAVGGITAAETRVVERMLGSTLGEGMPQTSWLVIGLTDTPELEQPGLWDEEAFEIYDEAHGDMAAQSEIAAGRLREIAAGFASSPAYAAQFFARKLAFEWSDPTFMAVYYSVLNSDATGALFGHSQDGTFMYDAPRDAFVCVYDGYQTVVCLLGIAGVVLALKRLRADALDARDVCMVLCLCFCAGFSCYVFWEAKGVYLLPFMVMLLPLAAYGLAGVAPGSEKSLPSPDVADA